MTFFDAVGTVDLFVCFAATFGLSEAAFVPESVIMGKTLASKLVLPSPHSELLSYWGAGSPTWGCGSAGTWFLGEASCANSQRPLPRQLLPAW